MISDPTPSELLVRFQQSGDELAFRALVDRYAGLVHAAAARRLGGRAHLAPDVAQIVFCSLAQRAKSLPRDVVLPAWLHTVAVRRAISMIRSETRRERREKFVASDGVVQAESGSSKIASALDAAIASMSRRDRDAIVARFLDDNDIAQTAQILGISYEATKKRVARALDRLRARLERRGVVSASAGLAAFFASPSVKAAPGVFPEVSVEAALAGKAGAGAAGMVAAAKDSIAGYPISAASGMVISLLVGLSIASPEIARLAVKQSAPSNKEGGRLSALPVVGSKTEQPSLPDEPFALEELLALPVEDLLAEFERLAMAPRTIKNRARLRLLIDSVDPGMIGPLTKLAQEDLALPPKYRLMRGLVDKFVKHAPLEALDFIVASRVDIELSDQGFGVMAYTLRNLWESDREACVEWLATNLNIPEMEKGVEFISHSMLVLALQSPAEALAIVERLPPGPNADRLRAALTPKAHYVDQSSEQWQAAVERVAGLPGAEEMLRSTVEVWAEMHDADVRAWIGGLENPETRFSAALGVLAVERQMEVTRGEEGETSHRGTPITDRIERAEFALQNAGGGTLDKSLEAIAGAWRPGEDALDWLLAKGPGGIADRAVATLAEAQAALGRSAFQGRPSSAEEAMSYAARIIDPELRATTTASLYLRWQMAKRDEAASWLEGANLPASDAEYLNSVKLP